MKKVLVTGANGFLGSHIIKELVTGGNVEVHGLIRKNSDNSLNTNLVDNVTWHKGDILDIFDLETAFEDIDIVIHSAAMVSYDPRKSKLMMKTNEKGTENVCNSAAFKGVKKLVYISSIAAIGKTEGKNLIDENCGWSNGSPHTSYSLSKYKAEMEVWRSYHEGLPVTILNPSVILGVGKWDQSSLQFIPRLAKGGTIYPVGSTGFVDVKDVASLAVKAIDNKYNGERYIVSGFNLKYKDLFDDITSIIGVKKPYIPLGSTLSSILWRFEYVRIKIFGGSNLLTKQTAKTLSTKSEYDNSKSKEAFDFIYRDKNETIGEMVKQFVLQYK